MKFGNKTLAASERVSMENPDYLRIEQAIRFLEASADEQPSLDAVAAHIGLSPFHFQRLFKRWAGVSPKRFLQYLTIEHAKQLLRDSTSVLDTAYDVGLSGPGRLHDLFVNIEAVTPGEYKHRGEELTLRYGFHATPFGECLLAQTERGICSLEFVGNEGRCEERDAALATLKRNWQEAIFVEDSQAGAESIQRIFSSSATGSGKPIRLQLRGTNFQLKVWEALLRIPEGTAVSYSHLAAAIGHPGASRAIGNAVGNNPVGYLIPCHRVLRATGELGGYKWGAVRKKAILALEAVQRV